MAKIKLYPGQIVRFKEVFLEMGIPTVQFGIVLNVSPTSVWISSSFDFDMKGEEYDLKTIDQHIRDPYDCPYKLYNKRIAETNTRYNGRFTKNDDLVRTVFEDGSNIWFTSDTHFCHENIMKFCGRPFTSTEDMNKALVKRWNSMVKPDDIVFHLGDFCFGGSASWLWVLERLNGHIHLILGNHDVKNIRQGYMEHFDSVTFQRQIVIEGRSVYLNHYPFLTYGGIYRKDADKVWQLFGHVHSKGNAGGADSGRLQHLLPTQYDVGVDNNNYGPVSWEHIKTIINQQVANTNTNPTKDSMTEEMEHLKLRVDILTRLLTPQQMQQYIDMTTDVDAEEDTAKEMNDIVNDIMNLIQGKISDIDRPTSIPITRNTTWNETGLDSLDRTEIGMEIEKRINMTVPEDKYITIFAPNKPIGPAIEEFINEAEPK